MEVQYDEVLKNFKTEYEKLTVELSNPEIFSDIQRTQKLMKKQKKLTETIKKMERLAKVKTEIRENEEILKTEKDNDLIKMTEDELKKLQKELNKLEPEVTDEINPPDPRDSRDTIVEIRAGTGGEEAALFAADLFRMYTKYAEKNGWQPILIDSSASASGGFKDVTFEINGENVYRYMKYESGVHRVQRIPTTEKAGRIHTSTASVAVLPHAEEADVVIRPQDLKFDVFRSGGPGGQNVNKTESAIRVTHLPTGLVVKCQDEKSQHKNKEKALNVLRSRLLAAEIEKKEIEDRAMRKEQIGTADRSEKIRTYNFAQNRVTDHRIKQSWQDLDKILEGHIENIVDALRKELEKKK
ncbi:MAG: peptide chain release factor 1 [bacterium]|nr:peptide chain release factor 1 [bacterium]